LIPKIDKAAGRFQQRPIHKKPQSATSLTRRGTSSWSLGLCLDFSAH
jgi:hypothetical protein